MALTLNASSANSLYAVTNTTAGGNFRCCKASASCRPVASGMFTSRNMTSTGYSLSFSIASRTLAASATTSVCPNSSSRNFSSERAGASSSTIMAFNT